MPRTSGFASLLLLSLFSLSISCTARPASEAPEPLGEPVPATPPPYRIVLASPRETTGGGVLPEGMVSVQKLGSGRLTANGSAWKALVGLAQDEAVRAVVMADAPQGTAALFAELKDLRPELLLVALSPVESPLAIQASADIILDFDHAMRAYSSAQIAARMGRGTLVSLSMPGANDDWRLNARLAVLRMASMELGLAFESLAVAPEGLEKALRNPGLGTGAVLVANDKRLAAEALRLAEANGALFIELDRPDDGYAEGSTEQALAEAPVGADQLRALIDSARKIPGKPGLALVWPGEQAQVLEMGALVFARLILDGKPASEAGLAAAMNSVWPAGQWHGAHYVDPLSGVRARNHLLTGSDPYLLGRSYLSSEATYLPPKYRLANW